MRYLTIVACIAFCLSALPVQAQGPSVLPSSFLNDSVEDGHRIIISRSIPGGYDVSLSSKKLEAKESPTCKQNSSFFELTGVQSGIAKINQIELAAAQSHQCKGRLTYAGRQARSANITFPYVSVATFDLLFNEGDGGGCHGDDTLTTYNLKDGSILTLKDVLATDDVAKIRAAFVHQFVETYSTKYLGENETSELAKDVRLQNFSNEVQRSVNAIDSFSFGIYIEKTKVYTILNLPTFSCAAGTFFPVQIPKDLLKPAFVDELHSDCQNFSPDCDD